MMAGRNRTWKILRKGRTYPMRALGRMLQILGLILLPLAMFMQLSDMLGRRIGLDQMLIMLVAGAAAFWLGRLLEGYAR